jgi:hypothetical protein
MTFTFPPHRINSADGLAPTVSIIWEENGTPQAVQVNEVSATEWETVEVTHDYTEPGNTRHWISNNCHH